MGRNARVNTICLILLDKKKSVTYNDDIYEKKIILVEKTSSRRLVKRKLLQLSLALLSMDSSQFIHFFLLKISSVLLKKHN